MCVNLPAIPITGTFNIAGTITVTPTTITWTLNEAPFPPQKATIGPGDTGSFAPLGGTTVTIRNLDTTTEPVGVPIVPAQPFISFDSPLASAFPMLNLNFIFPGVYSNAQCGAAPAVGQSCTLFPTSPFNFFNNPPPPGQATATFAFAGVTSDGQENWIGNFTSQFTTPFQTVLNTLATTGSVTNTFSATFSLTPVPEAGTMATLGLGLVFLSTRLRRRRK